MLFERNRKFNPITITLETEDEAELLMASLAHIQTPHNSDNVVHTLYSALGSVVSWEGTYKVSDNTVMIRKK